MFGTNVGIGSQGLVMAGSEAQKAEWLPRIASGEIVTSFALTEPGAGSDSASVQTKAVREGDVYRLTGTKRFITNADKASLFTVMARTGEPGAKGVSAFLVPADLPGVSVGKPEKKMGQQGAHVCDVDFDAVPVPAEIVAEMREMGLFGLSIPEEYGGLGLTMSEEARVALELGGTTPAFRSTFGTNVGIGSQGLVMAGSEAQKAQWLPRIASGEIVTSFALTEPGAGSDSASVQTKAVREGDVYRLTGTKRYITNADKASLFTVMARTGEPGAKGVSAFLVPADLPGVSVGRPEKKMGQQGAHVCDVNFDGAPVPAANRLGEEGEGFRIAMRVLDRGRLHIAAVCTGIAERLIVDSVAYAQERRQFGKPIADFQLIQAMIADSKTEAMAARALAIEAARLKDAGEGIVLEAAAASRTIGSPRSLSPADSSTSARAASASVLESAIIAWTSWNSASGLPNCLRSVA